MATAGTHGVAILDCVHNAFRDLSAFWAEADLRLNLTCRSGQQVFARQASNGL
jgi:hypothetical protein